MKLPISVKPNSTIKNKTGAWRTFKPGVDLEKCTGCGICTRLCPEGIISLENTDAKKVKTAPGAAAPASAVSRPKAKINFDYCKGCGLCARECPFKAIDMELEDK
ncbi:MAG: 4Fe-4S binding protein [Patescibacteria group bacterium]